MLALVLMFGTAAINLTNPHLLVAHSCVTDLMKMGQIKVMNIQKFMDMVIFERFNVIERYVCQYTEEEHKEQHNLGYYVVQRQLGGLPVFRTAGFQRDPPSG